MSAVEKWVKVLPIENPHSTACITCGCGAHSTLDMDAVLAVGFGTVLVSKGDEQIYEEPRDENGLWQASDAEALATKDPDHDWRILFVGPMWGGTYQRQGDKHWVLIEKDEGFA